MGRPGERAAGGWAVGREVIRWVALGPVTYCFRGFVTIQPRRPPKSKNLSSLGAKTFPLARLCMDCVC